MSEAVGIFLALWDNIYFQVFFIFVFCFFIYELISKFVLQKHGE